MNFADLPCSHAAPPETRYWPPLLRVADVSNAAARIGAVVCLLLTVGCAGIEHARQPEASPQAVPAVPMAPTAAVESKSMVPVPPTQTKALELSTADKAMQPSVVPPAPRVQAASKSAAAPSKAPMKPVATPPTAALSAKSETPAAALTKPPAAAPLDLKSLETRLKETEAIGVFTKLALKNQIDDLLDRFRAFYQGKLKTSLADLRRSYDMLVLKVLALLQDADQPLASAIASSRETIWGILSDPAKFAAV